MKKFLFLSVLLLTSVGVFADTNPDSYDNLVYIESTVGQIGGTATLNVYAKTTSDQGGFQFNVKLPTGVTFASDATPLGGGWSISENTETDPLQFVVVDMADATPVNGSALVATITVNLASTLSPGDLDVKVTYSIFGSNEITDEIVSTLTAQRAAIINDLPAGYGIEIVPGKVVRGEQTMKAYVKATTGIYNASFNIELPEGLYFMDEAEWDKANVSATFNSSAFTGAPTTTFTVNSTKNATVTISGAYSSKSKKYITATTTPVELLSFGPVYIATEEDESENDFVGENGPMPAEGISNIKVTNISLSDIDKTNVYTGESMASLGYGENTSETDPIVYGDYDITASSITDVLTSTPNVVSVDMSAATVSDEDAISKKLPAILVYGPANTTYTRSSSSNYGTICLPYELTSDADVQYYTVSNVTTTAITLTEATAVSANTPAVFKKKGTFTTSATGYNYAATAGTSAADELTFTGTYTTISQPAASYVISGDKFYLGNPAHKVGAFKAYFAGTIAGVKALNIQIEDETGIHDITDQLSDEDIYNLSGIKLNRAQKGINIIGGKKYLKK